MKQKEAPDIIPFYFKKLNKHIRKIEKDFDKETIHEFRIDVKKLRAWLRMLRTDAANPGKLKFPRRFKRTYSITGKIRDRQLYLNRLTENRAALFTKKITELEDDIKKLKKNKGAFLSKTDLMEIKEKIKRYAPDQPGTGLIKKFFRQKTGVIREITTRKEYNDKELHEIRKSLKDMMYILGIFRDDLKMPLPFLFWDQDELKKVGNISHTLGLFNDACIALSFISSTASEKADPRQNENLLSIRRQLEDEKQKLKERILGDLPAIRLDLLY